MWGRLKTLVLAGVVAAAALVPLFGDPRQTPVTHPLWARMLLRAVEMTDAVRASSQASQVFATLAWHDSLALPAERYLRAQGVVLREDGERRLEAAGTAPAEVVYAVAVVHPGDYLVRARLAGPAEPPTTAEIVPLSGGAALEAFALIPAAEPGWVLGGSVHLDPGSYAAQFLLPPGCSLSQVEVAPPCVNSIEPLGGWQPVAVTTTHDVAVTALKALDAENELAPAATPIEIEAAAFEREWPPPDPAARPAGSGLEPARLTADRRGARAIVTVELPEAGLYSIEALISPGAGQRWLVDGCRKAIVCAGGSYGWRHVLSQPFSAGRHYVAVTLGDGASLERVRIERKKDAAGDYAAALRRLGFDAGPDGPVSRTVALDAARFVGESRRARLDALCGDPVRLEEAPPATLTAQAATPPGVVPPPAPPPVEPPPVLPPQPPATPTLPEGSL
jgi:hypothetical protein